MKKIISIFLCVILGFFAYGCKAPSGGLSGDDENTCEEEFIFEHFYFETEEEYLKFYEQIDSGVKLAETQLLENTYNEYFCVELIVQEDFSETVYEFIPSELADFDIDWGSVLAKFAIGTSVIVVLGVVTIATMHTPIGYVFASSLKGAAKEGLMGGLMGAAFGAMRGVVESGGKFDGKAVKYAIEDAADGFMWGAITGALMGAVSAKVPSKLNGKVSDGQKISGKIENGDFIVDGKVAGSAVEVDGKTIVRYKHDVLEVDGGILKVVKEGKFSNITSISRKGSPLTVNSSTKEVFKNGKKIGYLANNGDVADETGKILYNLRINKNGGATVLEDFTKLAQKVDIDNAGKPLLDGLVDGTGKVKLKGGKQGLLKKLDDGTSWLMDENGKIITQLDDSGKVFSGWQDALNKTRGLAVKKSSNNIVSLVKNHNIPDNELSMFFHTKDAGELNSIRKYIRDVYVNW